MLFLNWKLNGSTNLLEEYLGINLCDINHVVFSPAIFLSEVARHFNAGIQNISIYESGAYTGEISASMVKYCGGRYTLVGHCERRTYFGETIADTEKKVELALKNDIIPVLCVGETLSEHQNGSCFQVLENQLTAYKSGTIIAYEPVWAIGTGISCEITQIIEVLQFLRTKFTHDVKILYGGSVNSKNLEDILKTGIDGVLVGSASLDASEVIKMLEILKK